MRRLLVFLLFHALTLLPASAGVVQPRDEHRALMDATTWPFTAIGRLNGAGRTFCTAVMVGPSTAVTAAHCVFNPRTGRLRQMEDLHVVAGFQRDTWLAHARAKTVRTGLPSYPAHPTSAIADRDWAVIELEAPIGNTVGWLPLQEIGDGPLFEAGYRHDRPYAVSLGSGCTVLRRPPGAILHDCTVQRGGSGSPLLQYSGGRIAVVGINNLEGRGDDGTTVGLAADAGQMRDAVKPPPALPAAIAPDTTAMRAVLAACLKTKAPLEDLLSRRLPTGCIR